MSLVEQSQTFERRKTESSVEYESHEKDCKLDAPSQDSPLLDTQEFQSFKHFRLLLEQKDLEIEVLKKENESLKLFNEIHNNIKEENLVLTSELSKRIKEIAELREKLEVHEQDTGFIQHNSKEKYSYGRGSQSLNDSGVFLGSRNSTAADSERRSSQLCHESLQLQEQVKEFKQLAENFEAAANSHTQEIQQSFTEKDHCPPTPDFVDSMSKASAVTQENKTRWPNQENYELIKKGVFEEKIAAINRLNDKIKDMQMTYEREIELINKNWQEQYRKAVQEKRKEKTSGLQANRSRYSTSIELELKFKNYENEICLLAKQIESLSQQLEIKDRRMEGCKKRVRNQEDDILRLLIENDKLGAMFESKQLEAEDLRLQLLQNRIQPRSLGGSTHSKQKTTNETISQKPSTQSERGSQIYENFKRMAENHLRQENGEKHPRVNKSHR